MTPEIIEWPGNLRISDRTDPQLRFNTRSGGMSLSGVEQIVSPLSSVWVWRAAVPIFNKGQARALRVVKSTIKGAYNYLKIRVCDQFRISRDEVGAYYGGGDEVPYGDGVLHSDGSGFALAQPVAPILSG